MCGDRTRAQRQSAPPPFLSHHLLAQWPEALAKIFGQELWLLPCREVSAFVVVAVEDHLGIRALRPAARRRINLVGKDGDDNGNRYASCIEEATLGGQLSRVPVETPRGDRSVRQPVERDVVEDVISR